MNNDTFVLGRIRCLVVDDEALIRERFRYAFPLEEHGFEIVGEAEDGEEALELCRQLNPEVVITDVVMPRMNGLELTERLKEQMPRVKVIILSSFQEFEFARKAVSLGALGYLLKITSGYQELLDILNTARREIEADRERMLLTIEERKQLQDSQPLLRKQLMLDLRSGGISSLQKLNATCDFVHWQRPGPAFALGIVSIDRYSRLTQTFHSKDISLFKYVMMRMIEEITEQTVAYNVFAWGENCIGLWMLHSGVSFDQQKLMPLHESILQYARQYLPFSVSVRISAVHPMSSSAEEWPGAFNKAFVELDDLQSEVFYHGHGGVHLYAAASRVDSRAAASPLLPDPVSRITGLTDPGQLQRMVRECYIEPVIRNKTCPDSLLSWLEGLAARWTLADSRVRNRFMSELAGLETIYDVEEYMLQLFMWKQSASQLSFDQPIDRSEIQNALDYVSKNYRQPISVAEISEHLAISPNYFSHLFKAQTGINFSDYVTRYRIEMSKNQLMETDRQVSEIAEQVGIPDYKYFARIFRRLVGKTPSQFREEQAAMLRGQ
ncbi:hypothetical protein C2I18_26500 [Paenibacillus sp. PK3_47]|uniref:response regulator transcription factor n=1 Tax=Paenibacillus sp. PK3_47 TaxID=2072642 RepID=UPI00201D30FD|nr:response regulator [Paenibacillus sp. PK3_47]UQZ36769.1 hypothetical protein C2I18_26500 [Paenibacillus sp. PK3_47]